MFESERCATEYPIVLVHGMGAQAKIMRAINYWGGIPGALRSHGADVYVTSVNAMDSHERKAASWKKQVIGVLEQSGRDKVNVIGHSDGCLYSRYAISNLGLDSVVASHTSLAGPHRGSCVADMFMGLIPDVIHPIVGRNLDQAVSFLMGDVEPDCMSNGYEETRAYMSDVFNPANPDIPGVYYQSYAYRVTNPSGAGLLCPTWMAMLPIEGDNDGLVSVHSAKWGEFRGVVDGGSLSFMGGVNHMSAVGLMSIVTPGYDPVGHFLGIAADLKERDF